MQEFKDWVRHVTGNDGASAGYYVNEVIAFMGIKSYSIGVCIPTPGLSRGRLIEKLIGDFKVVVPLELPAIVIVEMSEHKNVHAMYWDGQYMRDPSTVQPDYMSMLDFLNDKTYKTVLEWWPIRRISTWPPTGHPHGGSV
jgi:hypothetical protein